MNFIIFCIIWYLIGILSCIYYWTKESDLTILKLIPGLLVSILGPIEFIICFCVHNKNKILIKKRKK